MKKTIGYKILFHVIIKFKMDDKDVNQLILSIKLYYNEVLA